VLNEDEHGIQPDNGVAYTTCYDAIKLEVEKVNKEVTLVGPEIVGGSWYGARFPTEIYTRGCHWFASLLV
jgi:hypothetical protein